MQRPPRLLLSLLIASSVFLSLFGCTGSTTTNNDQTQLLTPDPSPPESSGPSSSPEPTSTLTIPEPTDTIEPTPTTKPTQPTDAYPISPESTTTLAPGWEMFHPQDNPLHEVWGISPSDVFAVGSKGTILHYNGIEWTLMDSGTTAGLYDIWGTSSDNIFAVGDRGTILHYDGLGWSVMKSDNNEHIVFVGGGSPTDIVAVTGESSILVYDGTSWSTREKLGDSVLLWGAWANSQDTIFAIMVGGFTSENLNLLIFNGSDWLVMKSDLGENLQRIWGSSATDVYAAGECGTIVHFDGLRWQTMITGVDTIFTAGWASSPYDVLVVGIAGVIVHYDGQVWYKIEIGVKDSLWGVWGSADSEIFTVGRDGTIMHYNGTEELQKERIRSNQSVAAAGIEPATKVGISFIYEMKSRC